MCSDTVTWPCKFVLNVYKERVRESKVNKCINSEKSRGQSRNDAGPAVGLKEGSAQRKQACLSCPKRRNNAVDSNLTRAEIWSGKSDVLYGQCHRPWPETFLTRKMTSSDLSWSWRVNESVTRRTEEHSSIGKSILGSTEEHSSVGKSVTRRTEEHSSVGIVGGVKGVVRHGSDA